MTPSSDNTSVATITDNCCGSNTLSPLSSGSTYIRESDTLPYDQYGDQYTYQAAQQVVVKPPDTVAYIATSSQGSAVCTTGTAGWSRLVTLELRSGVTPYKQSGISMHDATSIQSRNDLGASNTSTGTTSTNSSGRWLDTYFICSSSCPTSSGESDAVQSWTWNSQSLANANYIVYKCSTVTIDGN